MQEGDVVMWDDKYWEVVLVKAGAVKCYLRRLTKSLKIDHRSTCWHAAPIDECVITDLLTVDE